MCGGVVLSKGLMNLNESVGPRVLMWCQTPCTVKVSSAAWWALNFIISSYCCFEISCCHNHNNSRKQGLNRKLQSVQQWLVLKCKDVFINLCLWITLSNVVFKDEQIWVLSVMHNEYNNDTTRGCCWTRWNVESQTATASLKEFNYMSGRRKSTKVYSCTWLVGLGVWFSLRVREVPGSNPGRALLLTSEGLTQIINLILKTWGETQASADVCQVVKKLHIPELNSSDTCKQEKTHHTWEVLAKCQISY